MAHFSSVYIPVPTGNTYTLQKDVEKFILSQYLVFGKHLDTEASNRLI